MDWRDVWLCGPSSQHRYCPAGTAQKVSVPDGWYSLPEDPLLTAYRLSAAQCPPGSFCLGGLRYPCVAGTYYSSYLRATNCTDPCVAGTSAGAACVVGEKSRGIIELIREH